MRIQNQQMLCSHGNKKGRETVLTILEAGLQAADPYNNMRELMRRDGNILTVGHSDFEAAGDPRAGEWKLNLKQFRNIIVVGAGKGIQRVAKAVEDVLGDALTGGHVIAKHGDDLILQRIGVTLAAHPTPDKCSVEGSLALLEWAKDVTEDDLVITMIGNGGSSLMTLPVEGVALDEIKELTHILQIEKGVPTWQLNAVRNHLDRLKGGRLSRAFAPAKMIHIAVTDITRSDVDGKPFDYHELLQQNMWLHNLCDGTTFAQAVEILRFYDVWDRCPPGVKEILSRADPAEETVKRDEFERFDCRVFGVMPGKRHFIPVMQAKAQELGYPAVVLAERVMAQSQEAAKFAAAICKSIVSTGQPFHAPVVLLSTGEMVVSVGKGGGVGGRNQEYTLAMAQELAGLRVVAASCDSDGTDGPGGLNIAGAPSCLAGGIVDGDTAAQAKQAGIDIAQALKHHDTAQALWRLDCGIAAEHNISINDLTVILIEA